MAKKSSRKTKNVRGSGLTEQEKRERVQTKVFYAQTDSTLLRKKLDVLIGDADTLQEMVFKECCEIETSGVESRYIDAIPLFMKPKVRSF